MDILLVLGHILQPNPSTGPDHSDNYTLPDKIVPKILYSPDTPITRSIMHRANVTFATIEFILDWLRQIDNCSTLFVDNTNSSDGFFDNLRTAVSNLLQTRDDPNLLLVYDLINPSSPTNIWNILEYVSNTSRSIQDQLQLLDWDIFYPVESSDKLVKLASDFGLQKELNITAVFAGKIAYMMCALFTCKF